MNASRSNVVSSFTIIKGALIEETYKVFQGWDDSVDKFENLRRVREENSIGCSSLNWARDVGKVLNRRYDPEGRDKPLVTLARQGCRRDVWDPLLLFHMTRDEYLVRDFLLHWLYPHFTGGTYRLGTGDVVEYLAALGRQKGIEWSGKWTKSTAERVASGLLRMAVDFGLLTGTIHREFATSHMPDESLLYLLHALAESTPSGKGVIEAEDWKMFLMDTRDVERELLRLHQFKKIHYMVAGSMVELELPHPSLAAYVEELCA